MKTISRRAVVGASKYLVGDDGSVWSLVRGEPRRLKLSPDRDGYLTAMLSTDAGLRRLKGHHMVLEAFVALRRPGMVARHLDGNPANNRLGNLAWGTQAENAADRLAHGRDNRGEKHARAKLAEADVREMYRLRACGLTFRAIGDRFGVCPQLVHRITTGRNWPHMAPEVA